MTKHVKINDLELAIRSIDEVLPNVPTETLQKWKAILTTTLLKVENELCAVHKHTCEICFFQEYGYRDELPVAWHVTAGVTACFNHEYEEVKLYAKEQEAAEPFTDEEPKKEDKLQELMALL